MNHDVAAKPRIATALPCATNVTITFEDLDVGVAGFTELVCGDDAARARTNDDDATVFSNHWFAPGDGSKNSVLILPSLAHQGDQFPTRDAGWRERG
ncbi:unannotated protein [freshwater metagenome]|uniref:Unannotated protein n=1 Tax=freshwater metagenome TaxID=449393 RepID=A0A6J6FKX1_9ZZZZ